VDFQQSSQTLFGFENVGSLLFGIHYKFIYLKVALYVLHELIDLSTMTSNQKSELIRQRFARLAKNLRQKIQRN